jgi:hypothetical protein
MAEKIDSEKFFESVLIGKIDKKEGAAFERYFYFCLHLVIVVNYNY